MCHKEQREHSRLEAEATGDWNSRGEKGIQRGTNMSTWWSGSVTPTTNQKPERNSLERKDVGRGTAVQGAGWAGMQKDPWARRAPAQVVKAAGGSKTRTAWCSNCRDLHFTCGDFQSRPLSKHAGPAGCRSAHLILHSPVLLEHISTSSYDQ